MKGESPGRSPVASQHIKLEGECDVARKDELRALFDSLSADRPATIDLSFVTFIDSTVLSLLAQLSRRFEDTKITLIGPNANIRRVLRLTRFEDRFTIVDASGSLDVQSCRTPRANPLSLARCATRRS